MIDILQAAKLLRPETGWNLIDGKLVQAEDGTPRIDAPSDEEIQKIIASTCDAEFCRMSEIPSDLPPKAVDAAVRQFIDDSHCADDKEGLFRQTIESIANVVVFKNASSYFWVARENSEVVAYALTHVSKDVDGTLCYYMTQGWVAKKYRHTGYAKKCFEQMRAHAKSLMCRHIIVVSSRGTRGYLRFMGKQWHVYVHLLKEDI